jgi:hypothetical protein
MRLYYTNVIIYNITIERMEKKKKCSSCNWTWRTPIFAQVMWADSKCYCIEQNK